MLPDEVFYCCNPHCKVHSADISQYLTSFLNCISVAACNALPSIPPTVRKHKVPGWNDAAKDLRDKANFWYRVWLEAGSPSAGVLAVIKKKSKSRYKYEVRRLKRRREHIAREKLAKAFSIRNKKDFWQNVKKFRSTSQASSHHRIDDVIDDKATSELFRDKLSITLNKHACHSFNSGSLGQSLDNPIFSAFSFETVLDAIQHLKRDKKDDSSLVSNHFIIAAPVIAEPLANFFSVLLRHGFLPAQLVNCVLVPIPKPGKNPSSSDSYRPIALASTLSKILEWCILLDYSHFLVTSDFQFGFKNGSSTALCTGVLKQIVAKYIHNGSPVFACFLDASKAFDLVRHDILFDLLVSRGLPLPVVRLLRSWYSTQNLSVRWRNALSSPFTVSNGVRQGGVLSPVLFSIYLDELSLSLLELVVFGIAIMQAPLHTQMI